MHASKPSTRTDVSRPREYRLTLGRYGPPAKAIPQGRGSLSVVVRDAFWMPLTGREIDEPTGTFARWGELACPSPDRDLDVATAARKFSAARFEALYRMWQQRGEPALWAMRATTLRDHLQRGVATTIRSSKLFRLLSSDWKEARSSTPRMLRTEFQVFFKCQSISTSPTALTPHEKSSELTDTLLVGFW